VFFEILVVLVEKHDPFLVMETHFFFNKPTAIVHLVFCFATPRNEWQRDCPTSFDFQGMQVDLFQQLESAPTNSEGGRSEERVMK